jgi:uncharacterized protein (TIGR02217 family)
MMNNFSNVRFPERLSLGAAGGPEYSTIVHSIANGHEERIVQWKYPKYRFNLNSAIESKKDLDDLVTFLLRTKVRRYLSGLKTGLITNARGKK